MMKVKIGKSCSMFSLFSLFILIFSFAIGSCENPLIQEIVGAKTAAFESNGGSHVESQTVFRDQTVRRPSDPTRSGFTFDAWYCDNETFLEEWDFSVIPNSDITLYAKWIDASEPPPPTEIITDVAIIVTQPVTGGVPMASVSGASYTGTVSWSPGDNPFVGGVVYTATVTLTANQYFAFAPELESATINGNAATIVANTESSLTLSYKFPQTRTVTGVAITTAPKMSYTHGETLDLSALVLTITYNDLSTENIEFSDFASHGITVSMANGTALSRSTHNGGSVTVTYGSFTQTITLTVGPRVTDHLTVEQIAAKTYTGDPITPPVTVKDGATTLTENIDYTVEYINNTNAGTATVGIKGINNYEGSSGGATFVINKADIASVAITVKGPGKGETPNTTATGTGNFTVGAASWSPNHNPFLGDTVYTVSVTLTANENYAFAELTGANATINGNNATVLSNDGETVTLSYTFAPTETKAVTGISIKIQPTNLTYTHGDTLNLSGLEVTLSHDDGTTEDVAYNNFASKNITANPAHGAVLSHSSHDDQPVAVNHGGVTATTSVLSVNKANSAVTWPTGLTANYGQTLSDITLPGNGTSTPAGTFTWTESGATPVGNAGTQSHNMTFTPSDTANYNTATQNVSITVNKANPTVTWPTNLTATYGQTLSAIALPGNGTSTPAGTFTWTNGTTSVGGVGTQSHNMTFTPLDTANYNTLTKNDVSVTVNKAAGAAVSAPTAETIGVYSVTLTTITPPGNGQTVQYSYSTTTTPGSWRFDPTIDGISAGTTYYFFARSASNDNYEAGTPSMSPAITTMQNIGITITLDVSELEEKAPTLEDMLILSRTASGGYQKTASVAITGTYQSINWEIFGPGGSVTGTTSPITLNAEDVRYNSLGYHTVSVTVTVNGLPYPYQTNFRFRIVE